MGLRAHWKLRQKYGVKCADVWYKEDPDKVRVLEYGDLVERSVETTQKIEHKRLDITLVDRAAQCLGIGP